jgi:hypothetical protein
MTSETPVEQTTEEAAAAAQAAFAQVSEPDAKPAAKPEAKPEAKPAEPVVTAEQKAVTDAVAKAEKEAAAKAAAEAEWEGVPVKVRQTLEAISGKVGALDKIEHRLKGVEGRTGAALEGVHALKTALDAAKAASGAGGDAPTPEQIAAAAASSAKWKQAKEDYPDWAEAMDERLAALKPGAPAPAVDVAGLKAELSGTVGEIVAKATSEAKAEARELAKIDRKHESWEERINTPEFTVWRAAQPPEIQALGASEKAADAIRMLDAFEAHTKAVAEATAKAAANKKRLDSAIQPKGTATPGNRNISDEAAEQQGFNSVFTP